LVNTFETFPFDSVRNSLFCSNLSFLSQCSVVT